MLSMHYTYECVCVYEVCINYICMFLSPLLPKPLLYYFPFLMTLTIINHNFRTLSTTLKYIVK